MKLQLKNIIMFLTCFVMMVRADVAADAVKSKKNMISKNFLSVCVGADKTLLGKFKSGENMTTKKMSL